MNKSGLILAGLKIAAVLSIFSGFGTAPVLAHDLKLQETSYFAADVAAKKIPPIADRVPANPSVVMFDGKAHSLGEPGGELRMLIGRPRDIRFMTVFGYARLVVYDTEFKLHPDLLASIDVEGERIFTMHLRQGHKWSDGEPFTSEDFRYWWEDVANNAELNPGGLSKDLLVDGEGPKVEFPDALTVRFSWSRPNPFFLSRLAGPSPLYVYRPAHYLKKFHTKYGNAEEIKKLADTRRVRSWAALHNAVDNMYEADNPDLPTLEPWVIVTKPPATRFIAARNPYYHRIDQVGRQLPYIDQLVMNQSAPALIPVKSSAGETDLQSRGLSFANFTFLKDNEIGSPYRALLWQTAKGSHCALFPNLNVADPVWRDLFRDVRFRRALSLAINREDVNDALFFGLASESNDTVLPISPLFKPEYQKLWANYDLNAANKLLDEIGLTGRNEEGIRLLPDGRIMEIVIETSGEEVEQTDILELVRESWRKAGIKLFTKPSQREVMRNRVFSGQAMMTVWTGLENGAATANMSPAELAPTSQSSLQWPKWGQYYETQGKSGEPVDMEEAKELLTLNDAWLKTTDIAARERIWHRMLQIRAEQQFDIGIIAGVQQPVVASRRLRNLPKDGLYNWDPGAHFGMYRPDTFWLEEKPGRRKVS